MVFSRSLMHIEDGWSFSVASYWRLINPQPDREELAEVEQALKAAHDDFMRDVSPWSWTSSSWDMHKLRGLLSNTDPSTQRVHMKSDHQVAREIYELLERRKLIFVPAPWELKRFIDEERVKKARGLGGELGGAAVRDQAGTVERSAVSVLRRPVAPAPVAEFLEKEVGEDVRALLRKSPSLVVDLKTLGDAGWEMEYGEAGKGSHVNRYLQIIILDSGLKRRPTSYAQVLSHEVGHAMNPYEPDYSSKSAYLQGTLEDEAAATMSNIRTQREILASHGPDIGVGGVNSAAYNAAYDKFLLDDNAVACRQAIATTFGTEVTSNTGQTYADYYGSWYEEGYPSD
ncbi:hypothetical protein LJ656_33235 [Paraburkholderia sp. MMS20-SJTR3]|uniref:IrrE N-terminal-like domain-containing protein n=1 Tax=Paraburkholderia sejongensis TaxID=2886946 RepID=A0ABS8K5J1_9BURK|nr:hypothetical protein [Paraburkholderia sp. MMS20-SJTR3]MCC8397429.1 hypothetical protein [Paraburkholderia sp. MMS20-SJTR3]